jgi:hypothetical protein
MQSNYREPFRHAPLFSFDILHEVWFYFILTALLCFSGDFMIGQLAWSKNRLQLCICLLIFSFPTLAGIQPLKERLWEECLMREALVPSNHPFH